VGTDRVSGEHVRPLGAGGGDLADVLGGGLLEGLRRLPAAVHADGLEAVDGVVGAEDAGELVEREDVAADAGDHEQGRPAPAHLERDQ
jgi:hypothetical protein